MKTNYSVITSLPAYREPGKEIQAAKVIEAVRQGNNNLKALEQVLELPQSTISGRVNDCIEAGKLMYSDFVQFAGRKRKRIVLVGEQGRLFV